MNKFNRQYIIGVQYGEWAYEEQQPDGTTQLKWEQGENQLIINPFFTIKIDVNRSLYASMNTISIDIYNLNIETRAKIYYDSFLHAVVHKGLVLYAGYSESDVLATNKPIITQKYSQGVKTDYKGLPLIFAGRITRAYSYRNGVDMITHIEGFDLPQKNEMNLQDILGDTNTYKNAIIELAKKLGIENVYISPNFPDKQIKRTKSLSANLWEVMEMLVADVNNDLVKEKGESAMKFKLSYDNYEIIIIADNEYFEDSAVVINAQTGLLSTPIRNGATVTFRSLFEPQFRCGGYIDLSSRTTETQLIERLNMQGRLKVLGFRHQGTISPTVSGQLTTDFTCFLGLDSVKLVPLSK